MTPKLIKHKLPNNIHHYIFQALIFLCIKMPTSPPGDMVVQKGLKFLHTDNELCSHQIYLEDGVAVLMITHNSPFCTLYNAYPLIQLIFFLMPLIHICSPSVIQVVCFWIMQNLNKPISNHQKTIFHPQKE